MGKKILKPYKIMVRCTNCGWLGQMLAPRGYTGEQHVKRSICPVCETRRLKSVDPDTAELHVDINNLNRLRYAHKIWKKKFKGR